MNAAIVATPTHTARGHGDAVLLEAGIDVLVEKPIAERSANQVVLLTDLAERLGRILQVGHLERFNPAVLALEQATDRSPVL